MFKSNKRTIVSASKVVVGDDGGGEHHVGPCRLL